MESLEDFYEDFLDSDINFSDDESLVDFEEDELDEVDPFDDIDPFVVETLRNLQSPNEANDSLHTELLTKKCDIKWKRDSFDGAKVPFQTETIDDGDSDYKDKDPIDFFKNYFSDETCEQFALHTNEYAVQQNVKNFLPTNSSEIKILFGLHMLMGIIKLPRVKMYWSSLFDLQIFKTKHDMRAIFSVAKQFAYCKQ